MAQMSSIRRNNQGASLPKRRARMEEQRVIHRPSMRVAIQVVRTVIGNSTGHMESSTGKHHQKLHKADSFASQERLSSHSVSSN